MLDTRKEAIARKIAAVMEAGERDEGSSAREAAVPSNGDEPAKEIERLTDKNWRNLDSVDCCGDAAYCERECLYNLECANDGCNTLKVYHRLAQYEDTGLEPKEVALAIAAPMGRELAQITEFEGVPLSRLIELAKAEKDNAPLTLEEIREMEGEPLWLERSDGGRGGWAIYVDMKSIYGVYFQNALGGLRLPYDEYNKTWLAYRRRPEGKEDGTK